MESGLLIIHALTVVLPLFGILLLGYLSGRFGLMGRDASDVLGKFVFLVAFPAMIFHSLWQMPLAEFFHWPFLGALGGGMALTYLGAMLFARRFFPGSRTALGFHGLTAMFSSTGYIGLPILLLLFGDEALAPGIVGAVITGACFMPVAIIIAELDRGAPRSRAALVCARGLLRNPLLIATALGLLASAQKWPVPGSLDEMLRIMGNAYVPCALFSAGLFLVGAKVKGDSREIGWLVMIKLLIHPLITWWLAYHVFELRGILPMVAVIQAALPCGVPVFVIAQRYGVFTERANAVIVLTTALSVLTLPLLLLSLDIS